VRLKGDLTRTRVQVVEDFWSATSSSYASGRVPFDHSGVCCVDDAGRFLLALIHQTGVRMCAPGIEMRHHSPLLPVVLALFAAATAAFAAEPPDHRGRLFRFEFDNDTFLGSDDAFTAGWSLQLHTATQETWTGPARRSIALIPGLGDDGQGGRVVRRGYTLSQQIVTPNDITIAEAQPDDAPWAGVLALSASWAAFDDMRLCAFQITVACVGPCSGAEKAQKFVHEDLHRGATPRGWDNQLEQQWVANVVYGASWKLLRSRDDGGGRRWGQDLSAGSQVGLGNLATFADAFVQWRIGRSLPRGFTRLPDPAGMGVAIDPVLPPASRAGDKWRLYATVTGRATYMAHHVIAEGGATEDGPDHPGVEYVRPQLEAIVGLHVECWRLGLSVTGYRYLGEDTDLAHGTSRDWVALALNVRY